MRSLFPTLFWAICQSFAVYSDSLPRRAPFAGHVVVKQAQPLVKESTYPHPIIARQDNGTTTQTQLSISVTPTASPTASTLDIPLATSITDPDLVTLSVSSGQQRDGGVTTGSIELGCANCSTTGSLTLSATSVDISIDSMKPKLSGGLVNVIANGVSGYFELDLSSAALTHEWSKNIFTWPVAGIKVSDRDVDTGIMAKLDGSFNIALQEEMDITFGVNYQIPDGSHLTLDLGTLSNSSQNGFTPSTGLEVSTIPFQANFSNPTLNLGAGFTLSLTIGFNTSDVYAEAGIFADLPMLGLEVAVPTNVDANCNPAGPGATVLPAKLGNALNIIPSAYVDIGLEEQAGFTFKKDNYGEQSQHQLANETMTLPTACLLWDGSAKTLAPASAVYSKAAADGVIGAAPGALGVSIVGVMLTFAISVLLGIIVL